MERKYRQSLNAYDYQPEEMRAYLRYNGWHFNKKMCEWAVKQMRKNGKPIRMMSKDDIEDILKKNTSCWRIMWAMMRFTSHTCA